MTELSGVFALFVFSVVVFPLVFSEESPPKYLRVTSKLRVKKRTSGKPSKERPRVIGDRSLARAY